jgi:hypothetical protein
MRTTIFLSPPEGDTWPLDVAAAEPLFRDRWPSISPMRGTGHPASRQSIDFHVKLADQTVSVVYQDAGPLVLNDGTPEEWADTIVWFLNLLPAGTSVVTMTDFNPSPVPLDRTAGGDYIRRLLDTLNGES